MPVIDHWWQTETGWSIAANCMGLGMLPVKPGSPTRPVPGYDLRVLDAQGRTVLDQPVGLRARVDIALNGLAPGLYPVGIYRPDGVSWYSVVVR